MNLLIVEPGYKLWGSERALLDTLDALAQDGAENAGRVFLMAPPHAELLGVLGDRRITPIPIDIADLHRRGTKAKLAFIWSILRVCRQRRINRIYLNQAGPARLLNIAAKLAGIPLVIHVRLREDVPRCAALKASRRAPISLIFISQAMRGLYQEMRDDRFKSLYVIYDPYLPIVIDKGQARPIPLICVGRLAPLKGQDRLIKALASARAAGASIKTVLLGADPAGGSYEVQLRRLAQTEGVADLIEFAGYATDVYQRLTQAHFMALPSEYEPLGRVLFEAWDAGVVPIVSAQSGGAAEVLLASGGGLVYETHAPEAIQKAIMLAASLPEPDRLRMVELGRKWMRENLSIETYRERLKGVLFSPWAG